MGDFNHGNVKWDTQRSTWVEDQQFPCLIQDNFLIQHVLEPTRAARILYVVLSSQKEFVDNQTKQKLNIVGGILGKVTIRKIRKSLAHCRRERQNEKQDVIRVLDHFKK